MVNFSSGHNDVFAFLAVKNISCCQSLLYYPLFLFFVCLLSLVTDIKTIMSVD